MRHCNDLIVPLPLALLIALASTGSVRAQPAKEAEWARVTEDERAIKIETDKLEAVIPKANPKQWMTGIEKGSFLDKATGFREIGDGLMVIDWLMEAGSDAAWADKVIAKDGHGVGRYTWFENEKDPARRDYALKAHGSSHRKRMVEGPQLCHRMKPVQPEVIRGKDFVAVKTTYKYEYAAPGRKPGSRWTQLIVFPKGERYFVLMDQIDSVNDSDEMFLRNDTPGCVRHDKGDTFSEIYLSYLSGPKGVRIPAKEFFEPFPPDLKYGYRRDTHRTPEHFIRAYHLRDKKTGRDGPWLAGLTLTPSIVYEAWCSQRPGGIIVMIEEIHGRKVKAGESFSAAHIVGYFDSIEEMHKVNDRYKGHTALSADASGWRLGRNAGDEREVAGIKLCWCPAGKFTMGSPASELERRPGEDQVEVTLTKGFWMAKYEATQGQWKRIVGKLPGELTAELPEGDDYPVGNVNIAEAEAFCKTLTEKAHQSGDLPKDWEFRLPTEAQWEYACRAGTTTATAFGDKLSSKQANFKGKPYNGAEEGPSLGKAAKVGCYPANAWGLHDMHGNTFEWCRDWSHAKLPGGVDPDLYLAKDTAQKNRTGDYSRVRRGGAWTDDGWPCRSACRLRFEPERRYDHIGFRVVAVQP